MSGFSGQPNRLRHPTARFGPHLPDPSSRANSSLPPRSNVSSSPRPTDKNQLVRVNNEAKNKTKTSWRHDGSDAASEVSSDEEFPPLSSGQRLQRRQSNQLASSQGQDKSAGTSNQEHARRNSGTSSFNMSSRFDEMSLSSPRPTPSGFQLPPISSSSGSHQNRPSFGEGRARAMSSQTVLSTGQLLGRFQALIHATEKLLNQQDDVSQQVKDDLMERIRALRQVFGDLLSRHQGGPEYREKYLEEEIEQLQRTLENTRRQLNQAIEDRRKSNDERDEFQTKYNSLVSQAATSTAPSNWKAILKDKDDAIRALKEQVNGKRALWMEAHPGSSARKDAMVHTGSFESPTPFSGTRLSDTGRSKMDTDFQSPPNTFDMKSSSFTSPSPLLRGTLSEGKTFLGPPPKIDYTTSVDSHRLLARYGSGLPTGNPVAARPIYNNTALERSFIQTTEPSGGRPYHGNAARAITTHEPSDKMAPHFTAAFNKAFGTAEHWARTYSSVPNREDDRRIAASNQELWDYMMTCAYPGKRQESHSLVAELLADPASRFWFVKRLITEYMVKDIMVPEAFNAFNPVVARQIAEGRKALKEHAGLSNESRQVHIDRVTRLIQSLVDSKRYPEFRSERIAYHTARFRSMLGELLSPGTSQSAAGKLIGEFTVTAWDLSARMHTSRYTFLIIFPETVAKFSASSMVAKDMAGYDPVRLQVNQTRLKLVMTPVITMRDDTTTSLIVRCLCSSEVLVMPS